MKVLKKIFAVILGVLFVIFITVTAVWGYDIKAARSVKQVDPENPYLYKMKYVARYNLDKIINADIDSNTKLIDFVVRQITKGMLSMEDLGLSAPGGMEGEHCTSFQARNSECDGYLFGRNYDFFKSPSLVTFSEPRDGYRSIALTDMSHIGFSRDKLPQNFISKLICLAAIYAPVDGMNETGLCTSILALPKQPAQQETGRHKVPTTLIMRLWLDRCSTVDEALAMLGQYDIRHDVEAGSGYHYMVCDANGDCAVVEFDMNDGWKTMVVRKEEGSNSMAVTNHLLSPAYYTEEPDPVVGNPHSKSWWRYNEVCGYLREKNGILTNDEAQECLSNVHWKDLVWDNGMVEDTQFSNVYDQKNLSLRLRSWFNYDTTYTFKLGAYRSDAHTTDKK